MEGCITYLEQTTAKYADFLQNIDRQKHKMQYRNNEKNDVEEASSNSEDPSNPPVDPQNLLIPPRVKGCIICTKYNTVQWKFSVVHIVYDGVNSSNGLHRQANHIQTFSPHPPKQIQRGHEIHGDLHYL